MSPGATLGLLATVQIVSVMSPGPNTMLVIQNAARDRRLGFAVAAGCWPASVIWAAFGLAGLGSVLAAAPWLTSALHILCGAYLIVLGLKAVARSFRARPAATALKAETLSKAFAAGFFTNATNPKSIAYYMSVFSATGALTLPLWGQVIAITLLPAMGTVYYASLSLLVASGPMRRLFAAASRWLDRVAGAAMVFFGFKLLAMR